MCLAGQAGETPRVDFDAVVLAGGRAERLDGADKAALDVAGATLLDRALRAVAGARRSWWSATSGRPTSPWC